MTTEPFVQWAVVAPEVTFFDNEEEARTAYVLAAVQSKSSYVILWATTELDRKQETKWTVVASQGNLDWKPGDTA
jgi:hypothetical protein